MSKIKFITISFIIVIGFAALMFVTPYSGFVGMYIFSNMLAACWWIVTCTLDKYGIFK